MGIFSCDLLIAGCCEYFPGATTAVAIAIDYLQSCTRNGNFYLIEMIGSIWMATRRDSKNI